MSANLLALEHIMLKTSFQIYEMDYKTHIIMAALMLSVYKGQICCFCFRKIQL